MKQIWKKTWSKLIKMELVESNIETINGTQTIIKDMMVWLRCQLDQVEKKFNSKKKILEIWSLSA